MQTTPGFHFRNASPAHAHEYLFPELLSILSECSFSSSSQHVFDLGCGNGSTAHALTQHGYSVTRVDPSQEGIRNAHAAYPELDLHLGSAYDNLAEQYGTFDVIISLEVIEHVYNPRAFSETVFRMLNPGGTAILSPPYNEYLKNVAIVLLGKYDQHHDPLWNHGHIKFWSPQTLRTLLLETRFDTVSFRRVGRIPPLAKSMIAIASRPEEGEERNG